MLGRTDRPTCTPERRRNVPPVQALYFMAWHPLAYTVHTYIQNNSLVQRCRQAGAGHTYIFWLIAHANNDQYKTGEMVILAKQYSQA